MTRKFTVLTGIIISLLLMLIAISVYPGGSMFDAQSAGFDQSKNFISNLFAAKALNGSPNPSRWWAWLAMLLLPCSYALFFIHMAKKIPDRNAGYILKYGGIANIFCMFLIVTPLHDLMLYTSIALFWTCLVCITIIILKTKLRLFKVFSVLCVLIFYYSLYLWGTNSWGLLPAMQKINFMNSTLLILGLEYFTTAEDFAVVKKTAKRTRVPGE